MNSILLLRGISVAFSMVAIISFYKILSQWFDLRIRILGVVLLTCASWFLTYSRSGSYDGLFLMTLPLFLLALKLNTSSRSNYSLIFSTIAFGILLYIPGFIWLELLVIYWQRNSLVYHIKHASTWVKLIAALVFIILLAPFVLTIARDRTQMWLILGIPPNLWGIWHPAENLKNFIFMLFWHSKSNPTTNLGSLPLLDYFTLAMIIVGFIKTGESIGKTKQLVLPIVVGIIFLVLISLGIMNPIAIIGLFYILLAVGLNYILNLWLSVFPRNPIARSIGITLLCIGVAVTSWYHLSRYFIAWPKAPETIHSLSKLL